MSAFIIGLITSILKAFIPAAFAAAKPTMQDGDPALKKRKKLRSSIRDTWGKHVVLLILFSSLSGCLFTNTIYVPDGTPVRLRESLEGVKVWVLDKDGIPVASTMDLPEGWFALPMPPKENE